MWTDERRRRYNLLRGREQVNKLTAEEAVELAALIQELEDEEAAYLAPANARKAEEIAQVTTAIERLEVENAQLREYLRERRDFLERVKSLVAELQAEDQEMRDRFAAVSAIRDEHVSPSPS
jgi:predicted nuclease with TOPRIM domain